MKLVNQWTDAAEEFFDHGMFALLMVANLIAFLVRS